VWCRVYQVFRFAGEVEVRRFHDEEDQDPPEEDHQEQRPVALLPL